jgi:Zn-dependent protease
MRSSYEICRAFGIPIRVHISLLILLPVIALYFAPGSLGLGLLAVAGLFLSVALHELGHSLVGMACGYHIREIMLIPLGGMAKIDSMTRDPRHELVVSAAGPAVSLLLALLCWLLASAAALIGWASLAQILILFAAVNAVLGIFNLIPAFPMDGGRILRAGLTGRLGRTRATYLAARIGRALAFAFGIYSFLHFHLLHVALAVFIFRAAGAEYEMVRIQEMTEAARSNPFGWRPGMARPDMPDDEIYVSPPPYEQHRTRDFAERSRSFFARVFRS